MPVYPVGRLEVLYRTARLEHSFSAFVRTTTVQDTLVGAVRAFLNSTVDYFYPTTVFYGATWQAPGQAFSLNIEWESIEGNAAGSLAAEDEPNFLGFYARSTNGRRYGMQLFGTNAATPADYRYQPGESAAVDAMLTAWGVVRLYSGDRLGAGGPPYNYVNFGVSAYWQRQLRG